MLKKVSNSTRESIIDPFQAFENRFRKVISHSSKQNIFVNLNRKQLQALYNGVMPVIETSIFSEMEQIMTAICNSLEAVITMKCEDISLDSYVGSERHLKRFVTHVVTNYQSLQEQRIDILMIHNTAYQAIEDVLFGEEYVIANGFGKAFSVHCKMIQAFHQRYQALLFEGTILDTDAKIEAKVIEAVVREYKKELQVGGDLA